MRESIYGWYPAADEIRDSGESQYAKTGSYRYWLAKCRKDARWAPTPERPTATKIELLTRHTQQHHPLQSPSPTPPPPPTLQAMVDFAPIPDELRTPRVEKDCLKADGLLPQRTSHRKAWQIVVPQTPLYNSLDGKVNTGHDVNCSLAVNVSRPTRVKSAASSREKEHHYHPHHHRHQRRVKSAGFERAESERTTSSVCVPPNSPVAQDCARSLQPERAKSAVFHSSISSETSSTSVLSGNERAKSAGQQQRTATLTSRPKAPTPPIVSHPDVVDSSTEESVDIVVDFATQLKKYGWRMQVPGDPFNLKRPCIPKRHPFTVTVATPSVRPNPARAHMQNFNTYFQNTIPRRRRTFAIHDEWASEILHAKRMQLQKRDGKDYQYRTTNFSFIY